MSEAPIDTRLVRRLIAWTFLHGPGRAAFRAALDLDESTWARAMGWALWKALITLAEHIDSDAAKAGKARRVIDTLLDEGSTTTTLDSSLTSK